MPDKNCLSYWYPKVVGSVPTPKTEILEMSNDCRDGIIKILDGELSYARNIKPFCKKIEYLVKSEFSYPVFLRTGQTSGKHDWKNTCFLERKEDIRSHVIDLSEFSLMAEMPNGINFDVWVVREFLEIEPVGFCKLYGNMPLTKEFRFFVSDGEIVCWHPYWPEYAIEEGGLELSNETYLSLCDINYDKEKLFDMVRVVASRLPGDWSVDFLLTKKGWYFIDAAEASKSWHWDNCEKNIWRTK